MKEKILEYIKLGWGINQLMEQLEITKEDLSALMSEDGDFRLKIQRRYKNEKWIVEFKPEQVKHETPAQTNTDTPAMAALKAEADALGVKYNPMIGYDKLLARVNEAKAKEEQPEA